MANPKKKPEDRARKKSVSFPPEIWEYLERKAGTIGDVSKVVQAAVRFLRASDPLPQHPGIDPSLSGKLERLAEESPVYGKRRKKS